MLHGTRGSLDLDAQDGTQVVLVHGVDEHLERAVGLGLVLDQRVALAKAAQADAGLEVVHLLQIVHPTGIDDAQHDLGVELAHQVLAQALGLHVVALLNIVQNIGRQGLKVLVGELGRIDMAGELHDPLAQALQIALALVAVLGAELLHAAVHGVVHDLGDVIGQVLAVQDLVALGIDDLALLVHDVVVLKDALTHGEVDALDLVLGALDGLGDDLVLDGHVVAHVGGDHHLGDTVHLVATEQAHQIVLERQVELGLARIALTARTAAQLVVDTTGLMALSADDSQAAGGKHALALGLAGLLGLGVKLLELLGRHVLHGQALVLQALTHQLVGIAAQQDVGTTAGHVGGDGHGAVASGLSDDMSLALVVLGVEDLVRDAALGKGGRQLLGALNGDGTHQDRLAFGVTPLDIVGNGVVLGLDGAVHQVLVVHALNGLVGGNDLDGQFVDLAELGILGQGRTGHAGELVVQAEVVLQGDGGQRLVLLAHEHALFGLDGLVQALGVAAAFHDAAGELVDDLDLAVGDHVLLIAVEHVLSLQRLLQVVDELAREVGVDVLDAQAALDLLKTALGGGDGVLGLVHDVVARGLNVLGGGEHVVRHVLAALQAAHGTRKVLVGAGGLGAGARDDERRSGLIDQDGVDLVDDGVVVAALNALLGTGDHVVAQVVEAELGVGAVGDIGLIGRTLELERHVVLEQADGHAQVLVDAAHPLGVALGQVVIDGNDVHALAGDGVEIAGQRGNEGLAFTGLHLGDVALVQRHGANELNVKVAHAHGALGGLTHGGEGFGEHVVERLAVGVALAELIGLAAELLLGHLLKLGLKTVDLVDDLVVALKVLIGSKGQQL